MRRVQNIIMYAVYWIDDDKCCLCKDEYDTGLHFSIIALIKNYSGRNLRLSLSDLQSKVCS